MHEQYSTSTEATLIFDCSDFHGGCPGVVPVWVGYPALYCPGCRVLGHVDLVARHVVHASGGVSNAAN